MSVNSIELTWIAVKDLKQAVAFYTEVLGLKLDQMDETYKWAELKGANGGITLGIAEIQAENSCQEDEVLPGNNAIVTLTVNNLAEATKQMTAKGMRLHGTVQEVPGHVKLQMFSDMDGNKMQLVEKLA